MKMKSHDLLVHLRERTRQNLLETEKLNQCSTEELNHRNQAGSWNVLECLEHLNYYGKFYLPEIEKKDRGKPLSA